jgi:hypothetical protein
MMEVQELLQHGLKERRTPLQVSLSGVAEQIREMVEEGKMESLFMPIQSAFVLPEEHDLMQERTSMLETAKETLDTLPTFLGNQNTFPIFVQQSLLVKDILMDRKVLC